ncbi:MAG TPA: hypothetical protein VEW69_00025 [Alphaproteobacteria bacterium]|nr:hypothetical protein [Alphaproteobacteria bacterium]
MRPILASSALLFTIIASLSLGIGLGYLAVFAILRALGHKPVKADTPAPAIVSVASSH